MKENLDEIDQEVDEDIKTWSDEERAEALCQLGVTISKSEARRMICQQPEKSVTRIRDAIKNKARQDVFDRLDRLLHDEEAIAKLAKNLDEGVICVGTEEVDGCGYIGGVSGSVCPECGGMLLSLKSIAKADTLTAAWEAEKEKNKDLDS